MRQATKPAAPKRKPPRRGRYDRRQTTIERRQDQRSRLLAAAGVVFSRRGFSASTVASVVTEAGMSRRTFYEHFTSLRALLLELHEQASTMALMLIESKASQHSDPMAQLEAGLTAFMELLAGSGGLARVLFAERMTDPEMIARHEMVLARCAELLFRGAHDAFRKGHGSRPPDEITIYTLITGIEALSRRYLERKEEHRAVEAVPVLLELVHRAFR